MAWAQTGSMKGSDIERRNGQIEVGSSPLYLHRLVKAIL